ncbi:MAG: hypothetical protein IJ600_05950 [Lachnospiraceae bacterium]|nr:hypothetical protein [Lachnospiraceae bacterium]
MQELQMQISGITQKDGKKRAYVCFRGKDRFAEGHIPECVITKAEGFSAEEKEQLEAYMKKNLPELKKRAARINPLNAIMGRN